MAKRGRKRKTGKREPNGRPQRGVDQNAIAALMPHRRDAVVISFPDGRVISRKIATDNLKNELARTPFGRYYLIDALTTEQHRAGEIFAQRHKVAKMATSLHRSVRSIAGAGEPSGPTPAEMSAADIRWAIEDHLKAANKVGRESLYIVVNVCCYEHECPSGKFARLSNSLTKLAKYYGLTR